MKFLILFLLSINCFSQYSKMSDVKTGTVKKVFRSKRTCGEGCTKIPVGFINKVYKVRKRMIDDIEKPVFSKTQIEPCSEILDDPETAEINEAKTLKESCQEKLKEKDCSDNEKKIMAKDFSEIYCSKLLRYEKKESGEEIYLDEVALAEKQAEQALLAQREAAIAIATRAMNCGKRVMALLLVRNQPKQLKKAQVRNLVKTYKDIKDLLDTGSLESAREDILAVTINPPIVTQGDKDALIKEIDACKP